MIAMESWKYKYYGKSKVLKYFGKCSFAAYNPVSEAVQTEECTHYKPLTM